MDNQQEQLETLREIRSLMERSSRFLSLSGLSGIIAGIAALAGVAAAFWRTGLSPADPGYYRFVAGPDGKPGPDFAFLTADFVIVLAVALVAASLLSRKKARQQKLPVWDATAKRMLVNLAIPLFAGGIYCLILLFSGHVAQVAPATLLFYGLALLNASKYTLDHFRYLGLMQIAAGLVAAAFQEYGLLCWAFGFGVIHIGYGITMYVRNEK